MNVQVNHPTISVDFKTERVYPELEDLEVNPTMGEQIFKSNKYGFNEVKVKGFEGPVLDTENPIEITNIDNVIKISIDGDAVIKLTDDKTAIITSVETDVIKIEEIENYVDPQKVLYAESVGNIVTTNVWVVAKLNDGNIYLIVSNSASYHLTYINKTSDGYYGYICISSGKNTNTVKYSNYYKWNGTDFVYQFNSTPDSGGAKTAGKLVEIIGCGSPIYNTTDQSVYQDTTKLVEYGDY